MEKRREAGRNFHAAYDELGSADRAILRRAEDPMTTQAFWKCFQAARGADPEADPRFFARLVPLLGLLRHHNSQANVGALLADHKHLVKLRRVEVLFSVEYLEDLIDNLASIFTILKNSPRGIIDFGQLVCDLSGFDSKFHEHRARVRRSWAEAYFDDDSRKKAGDEPASIKVQQTVA